ncbi:MAG: hypothetical protein WCD18_04785 [Thermosynechococcaceae cyanobacterium]
MLTEVTLEQRLITLEQAVSDLQVRVAKNPNSENWLENLIGSISDDEAFAEALEHGRIFRQSDCSIDLNHEQS